ncbi:DUF2834 domain-containing protein [Microbacterium sp. cx-55]|uniref:DUF2834 domain-containing protein n=1 Tax=Microbacterium sp. cx-55 TaxID=2875948 RepID=UPI001CBDB2B3|nr:DUF2834 domain-containing protein [Microbacterium sp. cx-55]MBZ4487271.1 DUF2834 domain-containing protein [Microbacterium sp. cx-55]UGB35294.1 DUF2834 domain-containing protein [Microbacterium sp. cx-55]
MIVLYLAIAGVGVIGTWYFNLTSFATGEDYFAAWFATAASSSAATDVLVVAVASCVFFVVEGRRLGMRNTWALIPLTFLIALAFTFPLFLAWRHHTMRQTKVAAATP